jgi:hypothetical protein
VSSVDRRGKQDAGVVEGDEAGIEERIELAGEEEAVEDVEALGVGGAVGPWLGVVRQSSRSPKTTGPAPVPVVLWEIQNT